MKVRETVQFVVFPKFFNALSFYAKGNYNLAFKLCIEDPYGKVTSAHPVLVEGRDANLLENKRAMVSTQNSIGWYTTQQYQQRQCSFYITYNEESTFMNTLCLFKVEYEKGVDYKTYLDVNLNLTRFKTTRGSENINGQEKPQLETTKRTTTVDKRRIYINKHYQLNKFKRLTFAECQYFSFVDLYIGSVSLGSSIRAHNYQMIDFINFAIEERRQYYLDTVEKEHIIKQQRGKFIYQTYFGNQTGSSQYNLVQFYKDKVINMTKEYERLVAIYNGFRAKMFLLNNNSQLLEKIVRICLIQKLPALHSLREQDLTPFKILTYYRMDQNNEDSDQQSNQIEDPNSQVYFSIFQESYAYRRNVLYIWQNLTVLLLKMNIHVFQSLVVQEIVFTDDFVKKSAILKNVQIQPQSVDRERYEYIQRRKKVLDSLHIYEDQDMYHPLLMIEAQESSIPNKEGQLVKEQIDSLTIFVHGYQGSDYDLQKARNFMNIYSANTHGLLIKSIQQQDDMNIEELGRTVSDQIKLHIASSSNQYKRINFIGYSLGGVIARQSLKHLGKAKDRMNLFISFASPHLGIRNSQNSLVGTGVWYLVNVSKIKTMRQLHCQSLDKTGINTMKNLSECEGLSWFNKVILVSSKSDNFVPYYSSRMEQVDQEQLSDMCRKIKGKIKKLERMEVWFDVQHDINTWDKMLGRRAHIQFLENRGFLDSFFKIYGSQL